MLRGIDFRVVPYAAGINGVSKDVAYVPVAEACTTFYPARDKGSDKGLQAKSIDRLYDDARIPVLEIQVIDRADHLGVLLGNLQRATIGCVTQRHGRAHPQALLLRGCDLVGDPFGGHFAFELGEGQQHVQCQPPHASGRVEGLRDGDKGRASRIQPFYHFGKVRQRAREPVDLVNKDLIDGTPVDVSEQTPQPGAFHTAAGKTAIVIALRQPHPAFRLLAGEIGSTSLVLGVKRVELLLQPLFRALAGVDSRADLLHASAPALLLRSKNRGPDPVVPVICSAMADRELKRSPFIR